MMSRCFTWFPYWLVLGGIIVLYIHHLQTLLGCFRSCRILFRSKFYHPCILQHIFFHLTKFVFLDHLVHYFQYPLHIYFPHPHFISQTIPLFHPSKFHTKHPTLVTTSHSPISQWLSHLFCNVRCSTPYPLSIHLSLFYHQQMDKIKHQVLQGFHWDLTFVFWLNFTFSKSFPY